MNASKLRWPLRLVLAAGVGAVVRKLVADRRNGTDDPNSGDPWPPMADPRPAASGRANPPAPPAERPAPAGDPLATAAHRPAEPVTATKGWVDPIDGVCPLSHPVKVNIDSGVYHLAGGLSYERVQAERCYRSPEAAEADGFRRAER